MKKSGIMLHIRFLARSGPIYKHKQSITMTNINELFPSRLMRAKDINEDIVLIIKGVAREDVGDSGEQKPVLRFEEDSRGLVLNRTNADAIIDFLGTGEIDQWRGKPILLRKEPVTFKGETVPSIRAYKAPTESKVLDAADDNPY